MYSRGVSVAAESGLAAAPDRTRLAWALMLGALVALSLGVYGAVHDASGRSLVTLFFTATINLKVWLATLAATLALVQVMSAAKFYGWLGGGHGPGWLGRVHRASGTLAFIATIPVAYHCLWALGFDAAADLRGMIHGLVGCLFFGALAAKVLLVRSRGLPALALPIAGGVVFTTLIGVWLTSSFWFFTTVSFPGI